PAAAGGRRRRDRRRRRPPPAPRLHPRRRRPGRGVLRRGSCAEPRARRRQEPPLHAPRRQPPPPRRTPATQSRRAPALARERAQGGVEARRPMPRVAFVSPEPTPYRSPLLDRVAAHEGVDLTAIYAAHTVAGRTWTVRFEHRAVFLGGVNVPGAREVFRHDYPLTPGIWGALRDANPEVVVVSGWSTFAAQASIGWCRLRRVPYVLLVESHDDAPKPGWRRTVKETVVPSVVKGAASVLVVGSLARESVEALGADPARVRVFANTVDVAAYAERADLARERRRELRAGLGLTDEDVAVLTVARLVPEKGIDTLVRAVA